MSWKCARMAKLQKRASLLAMYSMDFCTTQRKAVYTPLAGRYATCVASLEVCSMPGKSGHA